MEPLGASTWYFAEGYTGPGFDQYLTILNPNPEPAAVTITYYLGNDIPLHKQTIVEGRSRFTVVVHEAALGVGRDQEVAARVTTTHPGGIIVERPIYFTYGDTITGGHNVAGSTQLSQTWYFAEGYTGPGFDQYLTILNPHPEAAPITLTYYLSDGAIQTRQVTVAANRRLTVSVHDTSLGIGRNQEVATKVETTHAGGIVVERPIYFAYGNGITGGHTTAGATKPHMAWYFAEGYTADGFDQYLTILNPHTTVAPVTITYYLADGSIRTKTLVVDPTRRTTVVVHDDALGVGRNLGVSAKVETSNPDGIVVERPMYFQYNATINGGHIVMGAPAPRLAWSFAEGYTGPGFDEYLTILNPNGSAADIVITYYLSTGATRSVVHTVGPTMRLTIAVHETALGVGRNQEVAARVTTTHPGGIIVERPIYFAYGDTITGGHTVLGFARE
jgi:hypothetical protein